MTAIAKILVIDDNPKYLADALPLYGYEVDAATDGLQGIKILSSTKSKYDLVLLDVMMPKMDGWETLKAIRLNKKTENLPVIMITALNEEQKEISGLKFGADDYITKPFILPNLLARIESLLRRSKWSNEKHDNIDLKFVQGDITPLTSKEQDILKMLAKGESNEQIGQALCVRETTVKTHLHKMFKKMKVKSRTQAVLLAMQLRLLDD